VQDLTRDLLDPVQEGVDVQGDASVRAVHEVGCEEIPKRGHVTCRDGSGNPVRSLDDCVTIGRHAPIVLQDFVSEASLHAGGR
jgi:hypothetical protein